jgi:hypothetical protein
MLHTSGHFSLASYRRCIVRCYCTHGGVARRPLQGACRANPALAAAGFIRELSRLPNHTEGVWGIGAFAYLLGEEMDFL